MAAQAGIGLALGGLRTSIAAEIVALVVIATCLLLATGGPAHGAWGMRRRGVAR